MKSADMAKLAIAGDIDGIFEALESLDEEQRDDEAYKWLCVASDHGHERADEYIDGLLEASSLRFDDDQMVTGGVHFELGGAYLAGSDGLPKDLERARDHLEQARDRYYPWSVQGSKKLIADLVKTADAAGKAIVAELFAKAPEQGERNAADDDDDDE